MDDWTHLHVQEALVLSVIDDAVSVEVGARNEITHGRVGGELNSGLELVKINGPRAILVDLHIDFRT